YGAKAANGDVPAPNTGAGVVHGVDPNHEVPLIRQTDAIDAAIGTRFGLRFVIEQRTNRSQNIPIHVRVTHPPINGRTVDQWDIKGQPGIVRYSGWSFDTEAELAPGQWKFQLLEGDTVVAEKEFLIRVVR